MLIALALLSPGRARAGGFEIPDNGTQALGRGAAFVAKADDPTAIYWNPAGLARQRGTKLYVGANVYLHSFSFARIGNFPDDPNDAATPWGGQPYPLAANTAGPFTAPFIAATSDFGLEKLTFGVGIFGPPIIGNRTFPLGIQGAPASTRYDFVQSRSTLLEPTASAGYRLLPWLDLGLSGHLILAKFDQTQVSYSEAVDGQCKNVEYHPCDSTNTLTANATTFAGTIGLIARPDPSIAIGASVRTPIALTAAGTLTPQSPKIANVDLQPGAATLYTNLPLELKLGGRYIESAGDTELYDLELDVTYETWGAAQASGPRVQIPDLGTFKDIDATVLHAYKNTFGVRAGGAYNFDDVLGGTFSLRAGGYFDSSATDFAYTRVDYDTLTKFAGTLGAGLHLGLFQFDLAYAAVASVPRTVGEGQGKIQPTNGAKGGDSVDGKGDPLPVVNEGAYRGFTHIVSLAASVTLDPFGSVGKKPARPKEPERTKEKEEEKPAERPVEKPSSEEAPPKRKPEEKKLPEKTNKKDWWEEMD